MHALKARKIGNSIGITLPKELLDRLNIGEGDVLYAGDDLGGIRLTPYDPEFEAAMEAFDEVRKQYRNALKELAK